jgi:hypothetical protein
MCKVPHFPCPPGILLSPLYLASLCPEILVFLNGLLNFKSLSTMSPYWLSIQWPPGPYYNWYSLFQSFVNLVFPPNLTSRDLPIHG